MSKASLPPVNQRIHTFPGWAIAVVRTSDAGLTGLRARVFLTVNTEERPTALESHSRPMTLLLVVRGVDKTHLDVLANVRLQLNRFGKSPLMLNLVLWTRVFLTKGSKPSLSAFWSHPCFGFQTNDRPCAAIPDLQGRARGGLVTSLRSLQKKHQRVEG